MRIFILLVSLLYLTSCEKDTVTPTNYRFLHVFKNGNPYQGEVKIYNQDSTFNQSVMCDPEYAIFVPYEIEYGYEIRLNEGLYLFEMVGDTTMSKTIEKDVYIDY